LKKDKFVQLTGTGSNGPKAFFKERCLAVSYFIRHKLKNTYILFIIFIFLPFGCSEKKDVFHLESGTQSYLLAKDLATIIPSLDPDITVFLVKSNKFVVTASEAVHELRLSTGQDYDKLKGLKSENLKNLIEHSARKVAEKKLLLAQAEKSNMSVAASEIAETLNRQYVQADGEEKFLEMIRKNGLDIEYVKEDIRKDLLVKHYTEEKIYSNIQTSEEEIRALYQKDKTVTVRHILLSTQGTDDSGKKEVRKQIEQVLSRARRGEDFSELAKQYSQDLQSKDKGGLYKDIGPEFLMKALDQAAFSVPVGEVSDIIETPMGYHILKVIERRKENRPLDEVRSRLEAAVRQKKQTEAYRLHLIELGEKYDVLIARL
jgi:parvulin-like peptidyl-prolyl isomerase